VEKRNRLGLSSGSQDGTNFSKTTPSAWNESFGHCRWLWHTSLSSYKLRNFEVSFVENSVSKEQLNRAESLCEGLPCKFLLCDYRNVKGEKKYDGIVSVAFFKHFGKHNQRELFK